MKIEAIEARIRAVERDLRLMFSRRADRFVAGDIEHQADKLAEIAIDVLKFNGVIEND